MRKMLMLTDREEISRGLAESLEYQEIGHRLGRDSSVISREVARHGGRERYRAAAAHEAACAGRERPKLFAVERSARLRAVVCQQLRDGWSPASIAGRLPVNGTRMRTRDVRSTSVATAVLPSLPITSRVAPAHCCAGAP